MRQELINRRARALLADELSGWHLDDIHRWFSDAGVVMRSDATTNAKSASSVVAAYLGSLDLTLPSDAAKFIKVANPVVREIETMWEYRISHAQVPDLKDARHPLTKFLSEMDGCGFLWSRSEFVNASLSSRLADLKFIAEDFKLPHLDEHINRIEQSLATDPGQAIGSAKEMVETVAKTILNNRGVSYAAAANLLVLGRLVFKTLKQLPDDVSDELRGSDVLRVTLSNLASVVHGIAELRGLYGTGHGQLGTSKGLHARHAKLMVGAAATLATYWVETDRDMDHQ